jgi:hypothetical protein
MSAPRKGKAPIAMARPEAQENNNDTSIITSLADSIKASVMAGEVVTAADYPEGDRPLFWAAIARVRDDLPCVKPIWRTINEQHVDGIRTRQKMFRICTRQKGSIDRLLAGLVVFAAICAGLLCGVFP